MSKKVESTDCKLSVKGPSPPFVIPKRFSFRCLTQGLQFDASIMESEEEEEAEPATTQVQAKAQKRRRSSEAKPKKKRPRRVKQKRGYYASSDEAEVEDEVYSEAGDARSLATQSRRIERIDEVLAKV